MSHQNTNNTANSIPFFPFIHLRPDNWNPIWDKETIPGKGLSEEYLNSPYFLDPYPCYKIEKPDPEKFNHTAVIIFPGGGYHKLAAITEGQDVADWMKDRGFLTMTVLYRVADTCGPEIYPSPLLDARRAIRILRSRAKELEIENIGVMGFSAGGHLASTCMTLFNEHYEDESHDEYSEISCRPDFGILVYPVIDMDGDYRNEPTMQNLLGKIPLQKEMSTHQQVHPKTPPVFLIHSLDDGVMMENSIEFSKSCSQNKVPVSLHLLPDGRHAWGMKGRLSTLNWGELLEVWLKRLKLMI